MLYNNYHKIIQDFLWYYENNYITPRDGNAMFRLTDKEYVVTASGVRKQEMSMSSFLTVNKEGKKISTNEGKPSIETMGHLIALQKTDKSASVHVHSPATVALFAKYGKPKIVDNLLTSNISMLEEELNHDWPELFRYTKVGKTVPFLEPGSEALHHYIGTGFAEKPDIIVLEKHGVIAVGETLEDCREHIMRTEHICRIILDIGQ